MFFELLFEFAHTRSEIAQMLGVTPNPEIVFVVDCGHATDFCIVVDIAKDTGPSCRLNTVPDAQMPRCARLSAENNVISRLRTARNTDLCHEQVVFADL